MKKLLKNTPFVITLLALLFLLIYTAGILKTNNKLVGDLKIKENEVVQLNKPKPKKEEKLVKFNIDTFEESSSKPVQLTQIKVNLPAFYPKDNPSNSIFVNKATEYFNKLKNVGNVKCSKTFSLQMGFNQQPMFNLHESYKNGKIVYLSGEEGMLQDNTILKPLEEQLQKEYQNISYTPDQIEYNRLVPNNIDKCIYSYTNLNKEITKIATVRQVFKQRGGGAGYTNVNLIVEGENTGKSINVSSKLAYGSCYNTNFIDSNGDMYFVCQGGPGAASLKSVNLGTTEQKKIFECQFSYDKNECEDLL